MGIKLVLVFDHRILFMAIVCLDNYNFARASVTSEMR